MILILLSYTLIWQIRKFIFILKDIRSLILGIFYTDMVRNKEKVQKALRVR